MEPELTLMAAHAQQQEKKWSGKLAIDVIEYSGPLGAYVHEE